VNGKNDSGNTLIADILTLWSFLGKRRRWQLGGLFLLMSLSALFEMLSLGAVLPFLGALADPEKLLGQPWFRPLADLLRITSPDELLLPMTILFISAAICAAALRILLLWANTRLSGEMTIQLREEIYRRALYLPYEKHLQSNSSELISLVSEKIAVVSSAAVMHLLILLSALLSSLAIVATLFYIDPLVASITFAVLGGGYLLAGHLSKKLLQRNSRNIAMHQPLAIRNLQEGIGGIRDVILDHSQETFLSNYSKHIRKVQTAASNNAFLAQFPKSLLELTGITLIAGIAYYLQIHGKAALPILGALALGSQRLLPSLQQIYFSWSTITGARSVVRDLVNYLKTPLSQAKQEKFTSDNAITFHRCIRLENVYFRYQGSENYVLENINLTIPKGSRIGFIGQTGCGKSTLLDIIMGLLTPTKGKLYVDDIEINELNRVQWQKSIAHVPQSIYLADTTIMENIAFGVPKDKIDVSRLHNAARMAHIDEFIRKLPKGYETKVGERGVQLSGGQRQRIGIARALYKNAQIIIFDEATSALDEETEHNIMESINSISNYLSILFVTHRLESIKTFDKTFIINNKKVQKKEIINE
jgi:ATP-binding cassette subfamily B protein